MCQKSRVLGPISTTCILKTGFPALRWPVAFCPLFLSLGERELFDWSKLKEEKDSFQEGLSADLVFSLPLKLSPGKPPVLIRLAVEHKSWKDSGSYEQMLKYRNRLAERLFRENGHIPGIFNILIYHGKAPLTGPLGFEKKSFSQKKTGDRKLDLLLSESDVNFHTRLLDIRQNLVDCGFFEKGRGFGPGRFVCFEKCNGF